MRSNTVLMATSAVLVSFACGCAAEVATDDERAAPALDPAQAVAPKEYPPAGPDVGVPGNPAACNPADYSQPGSIHRVYQRPGRSSPGGGRLGYHPPDVIAPTCIPPGYGQPGYR